MLDAIKDFFGGAAFCQCAADIWNTVSSLFTSLLLLNPQKAGGGAPWGFVNNIYPYFLTIASSLLVLFFIIGYCRENIDLKQPLTFEKSMTMILRLLIANGLMTGILTYIPIVFRAGVSLTQIVMGSSYQEIVVPEITEEWSFLGFILGFITICVAIAASVVLIMTVYTRFIKILLIIPLAPIAMSSFAGGGTMSQTGIAWIKTFLGYVFEVVVMSIAFGIGNTLVGGADIIPDKYEFVTAYARVSLNMIIAMVAIVGAVKGAEATLRRAMSL